jgi:hypothetical protein
VTGERLIAHIKGETSTFGAHSPCAHRGEDFNNVIRKRNNGGNFPHQRFLKDTSVKFQAFFGLLRWKI